MQPLVRTESRETRLAIAAIRYLHTHRITRGHIRVEDGELLLPSAENLRPAPFHTLASTAKRFRDIPPGDILNAVLRCACGRAAPDVGRRTTVSVAFGMRWMLLTLERVSEFDVRFACEFAPRRWKRKLVDHLWRLRCALPRLTTPVRP
ncbi:MAG TPA: hypothetical protein P5081_18360 [Phycisphaerae bacterium]|nr:hypothetical protein [Phycisphaerae bacterium]HRW54836.1 hypothetical protein [Phycisphaerae bacterium]